MEYTVEVSGFYVQFKAEDKETFIQAMHMAGAILWDALHPHDFERMLELAKKELLSTPKEKD